VVAALERLPHRIDSAVTHITERLDIMSSKLEQLRVALDAATTAIGVEVGAVAARLQTLNDKIAELDADPATVSALQADIDKLNASATALQQLAADPANPVPTPEPTPPADPTTAS
jgi:Tfp pilus assembly protein PilN